ncbi:MAG: DUF1638 domain-containing protein [Deltaproteobacteria bacterium]|jgi:hypothetical protein|nr:DUF1638 domain-containing protein [Deltaproteobacteria bacterium]
MPKRRVLIYCGIFDDELAQALEPLREEYEILSLRLKPGYHCLIEELEAQLEKALQSDLIRDKSEARLFIGSACLPNMKEFAARHGAKLLPTENCLTAMVGRAKLLELERNKTMVATPAWIRKMFLDAEGVMDFMRWDETDFRINFGRYERVLVLETTAYPSDEEILRTFELFGGNAVIEPLPCSLDSFNEMVREFMA